MYTITKAHGLRLAQRVFAVDIRPTRHAVPAERVEKS